MRNKILNCQNFAFHNVTLRFSHHALSELGTRYFKSNDDIGPDILLKKYCQYR